MYLLYLPHLIVTILEFLFVFLNSSTVDGGDDQKHLHPHLHHLVKRLVGGEEVLTIEEAPFVVQLIRGGSVKCTGSIIASDIILTAAHCTQGIDLIAYGTTRLYSQKTANSTSKDIKVMKIKKIITHPQYVRTDSSKWSNDVAILKLRSSILPDSVAQAIALPTSRFETIRCGAKVRVFGFGKVADRHEAAKDWRKRMSKKSLQVMETAIQDSCWTDSRAKFITTKMFNRTVCHGDSGGALVSTDFRLIGVTARSSCLRGRRDLFVSVASHLGTTISLGFLNHLKLFLIFRFYSQRNVDI